MRHIFTKEDREKAHRIFWERMRNDPKAFEEYRRKMSQALKGKKKPSPKYHEAMLRNWQNPEYRRKQSKHISGEKNPAKRPEVRRKISINLARRIAAGKYPRSNTTLEKRVQTILDKMRVKYIAQYPLGNRVYDFAIPSKRLLINVNGCYWHGCDKCYPGEKDKIQRRIRTYDYLRRENAKKNGWILLEIWEHELNELPEEEIINKIEAGLRIFDKTIVGRILARM